MSGEWILAFGFWLLLTGDASPDNLIIGLAGAVAVSRLASQRVSLPRYLRTFIKVLAAVPLALFQSFHILLRPHRHEQTQWIAVPEQTDPWDRFEQIFLITMTPKTLATASEPDGKVQVHSVERKRTP